MSNLPDISHLRGMSEPFFFSFNILDKRPDGRMVGHAVIFTSFELSADHKIKLCTPEDDPRMPYFTNFCIENYGKKAKQSLGETVKRAAEEVNELEKKIQSLRRELRDTKTNQTK